MIGEGLTPGAEVKFRGLMIGSVKTLQSVGYNRRSPRPISSREPAPAADTTANFVFVDFGLAAVDLVSTGAGPC